MAEMLKKADFVADDLIRTVITTTRDVLGLLLSWRDLREFLRFLIFPFGLALVGSALVLPALADWDEVNFLEVILALVGFGFLFLPASFLVFFIYAAAGGVLMFVGGLLLKTVVLLSSLVRRAP